MSSPQDGRRPPSPANDDERAAARPRSSPFAAEAGKTEGGRHAEGGKLDLAIARAVRGMLDVEPPAGLRGRVLDRIENPRSGNSVASAGDFVASAFGRKAPWILAPIAAAAVIVLAILLPWRSGPTTTALPVHVAAAPTRPSATPLPPAIGVLQPPPQIATARVGTRSPRALQTITAAVATSDPDFPGSQIEALVAPEPLAIARLAGPPAASVQTLGLAPIEIRALEVNAITEAPQERREE
jgi:hypothetical protein